MSGLRTFDSICDACLQPVPSHVECAGRDVLLVRNCPQHGRREYRTSRNGQAYLNFDQFRLETMPPSGQGPEPSKSFFFITPSCNQGCSYCLNEANEFRYFDDYDAATFAQQLAQSKLRKIALVGGEPFAHPRFWELVQVVRSHGKSLQLYTNGLALADRALVQRLVEAAGPDCEIFMTFEGFEPELYEWVGAGRVRERKLAALKNLEEFQLATTFHQTVPPEPYQSAIVSQVQAARELAQYALEHGYVRALAFQSIVAIGGARGLSAQEVTSVDLTMDRVLESLPVVVTRSEIYALQKIFALLSGVMRLPRCPHLQFAVLVREAGSWHGLDRYLHIRRLNRRLDARLRGRRWSRAEMLWALIVDTLASVRWRQLPRLMRLALQVWPVLRGGLDASRIPRNILPVAASTVCDRFNYDADLVPGCDKRVFSTVEGRVIAELAAEMSLRQMRQRAEHEDDDTLRMPSRLVMPRAAPGHRPEQPHG